MEMRTVLWLLLVGALCGGLGFLEGHSAGTRAAWYNTGASVCDACEVSLDVGDQGNVLLHQECVDQWIVVHMHTKAAAAARLSDIRRRGLAVVIRETAHAPDRR